MADSDLHVVYTSRYDVGFYGEQELHLIYNLQDM